MTDDTDLNPAAVLSLFAQPECRGFTSATDAIPPPQPEPRAMREHLVVPSIRSRDVAWA